MICTKCEYKFQENDTYYGFLDEVICEMCIDEYIEEFKDEYKGLFNPKAEHEDLELDIQRGK